ncbi:MAG: GNAT family N-acetyltransferase [Pirellulales bacterium]|nr:GNAT family N-acetyltransferase [Pirellulales bacterium]
MSSIRICDDLEKCRLLWQEAFPNDSIFHLWEMRNCFQQAFNRTPCFIACEDANDLLGLLPLSRIDETGALAFFPGETWNGKTWLEQNRIFASSPDVFHSLLEAVPADAHIRYVEGECVPPSVTNASLDEIGYLFLPAMHTFSFQTYLNGFPKKTLKRLHQEPNILRARGVTFRYDCRRDIEQLFRMNFEAFGENSYFHDKRFLHGFENLIAELDRRGSLRITTVLVAGEIAAVDVGAVCRNAYTLLAGGTNRDFPGVAKLINFHHLEVACRERFHSVDFLCGDFGWKRRFRLAARPLYQISLAIADIQKYSETDCSLEILANA